MVKVARLLMGVAFLCLLWAGGTIAYAHAELREAYPPIGAAYRWERPSEIRLSFTQAVELVGSSITLTNHQFVVQPTGELRKGADDSTLIVDILADPFLGIGTYTVNWKTASVDGHTIQGSYDFTLLPREALITLGVAAVVLVSMGIFIWFKRDRTITPSG